MMRHLSENILVDTHVHFYRCYERKVFFEEAFNHFHQAAQALGLNSNTIGCLVLTETSEDHFFREFREEALKKIPAQKNQISFHPTSENYSLMVKKDGLMKLIVIAGRQVVTQEGIEVLALGCDSEFQDGMSILDTIKSVQEHGALAVLPWGFGKWNEKNVSVLFSLIESEKENSFFLGDTSARLCFLKEPSLFRFASSRGVPILAGSDPLPFSSHGKNAGRYGIVLKGKIDFEKPMTSMKYLLCHNKEQPQIYGRRENILNFCYFQTAMQIRKRFRKIVRSNNGK